MMKEVVKVEQSGDQEERPVVLKLKRPRHSHRTRQARNDNTVKSEPAEADCPADYIR
jgi:hypothetical protein